MKVVSKCLNMSNIRALFKIHGNSGRFFWWAELRGQLLQARKSHLILKVQLRLCRAYVVAECGFWRGASTGQEDCRASEQQPGGEGHGERLKETEKGHRLYDHRVSLRIYMAA